MRRPLPPLVLAYHGVASVRLRTDPYRLFTNPRALLRHIRRLRSWGYQFVTLGELAGRLTTGDAHSCAVLTFDDGLADNLYVLAPLLTAEKVPATAFVVSGWDGVRHPDAPWARTMTAKEVRELSAAGVEVGSHSASHRDLSALSYSEVMDDLQQSPEELSALIDRTVDTAAYPFGRASNVTRRACRNAEFTVAVGTNGKGRWEDRWDLLRQDMVNGATLLGLRLKRDDRYEALVRTLPGHAIRGLYRRSEALVR